MSRSLSELPCYTTRLDQAVALATDAFRHRIRKGSRVPYITHLFQVMVLVGEHGGDEDQMIAAVLHDYLEDIEGTHRDDLAARFGERVAQLVEGMSDSTTHPKPPWEERKREHVARMAAAPHDLKLISAADKLHNARSILRDMTTIGDSVWNRFTATREQTLWYYRAMLAALESDWDHPLLDELRDAVDELVSTSGTIEED